MALSLSGYQPSEKIVSPGAFTRELDQSFLAQGVAAIGGVVVAPFPKGPGFSPVVLTSEADLTKIFGDPDGILYGPYTAQQYIRQQGQVTVCRVGGLGGYEQHQALVISAQPGQYARVEESGSFSGSLVGAVITNDGGGAFWLTGDVQARFLAGEYSGSTVLVGHISSSVLNPVSSSHAHLTSGELICSFTSVVIPHVGTIHLTSSLVVEAVSSCLNRISLIGNINGAYGVIDVSSWTPYTASSMDECGVITTASNARDEVVLAVLANTAFDTGQNLRGFSGSVLTPKDLLHITTDYRLQLNEQYFDVDANDYVTSSYGTYEFSLDKEASSYLTSVFGEDPQAGFTPVSSGQRLEAAYTYKHFDNRISEVITEMLASGSWKIAITPRDCMLFEDGITPDVGTSTFDLRQAETPFIRSQQVAPFSGSGGSSSPAAYDLFKVHTLSDGTDTNTSYKIEISNVRAAGSVPGTDWGSFTLSLRSFSDNDVKTNVLERYDNLNLNQNSTSYVGRRIGDMYNYIDFDGKVQEFGDYKNVSKLIRVEMATAPWPMDSIPFGFGPYASPIGGDYAALGKLPAMQYCSASVYAVQPGRYASGVVFQPAPSNGDATLAALYPNGSSIGPELDNKQYFAPIPLGASVGHNVAFDLGSDCGVTPYYVPADETTNVKKRRFVLGFQYGFDGQSPSVPVLTGNDILPTNQQGLDCSTNTAYGSYAYRQCVAALSNADEWDFNLVTTPGINYEQHGYVTSIVVEMCENRGDAFYIADLCPNQNAGAPSQQNIVNMAAQFDTSYAGAYYPWVKIADTNTQRILPVPPSVVMMSVYAANDAVAAEWFAPAGLNRGGIPAAVQVIDRTTHSERDTLYEGRVNPIAAFPGQGIVAWGQKTLQRQPSALDRINVRRLLIALKKFIASSSRYLVFEQNVAATRAKFLNIVNPYLEGVQQRSGLYAFKVVMDASNNTPDIVDRNILYGQIFIQPSKVSEFIVLDFNVMPQGASFSE